MHNSIFASEVSKNLLKIHPFIEPFVIIFTNLILNESFSRYLELQEKYWKKPAEMLSEWCFKVSLLEKYHEEKEYILENIFHSSQIK